MAPGGASTSAERPQATPIRSTHIVSFFPPNRSGQTGTLGKKGPYVYPRPPAPALPAAPQERGQQLHTDLLAGDAAAADRMCANLPRLTADAAVGDVSLMEAQHVLAREYGFREWPHLAAAARFDFDGLADLSEKDMSRLVQEVGHKIFVISLKCAGDDAKQRLPAGMHQRGRAWVIEELEIIGPISEEEAQEAQRRILHQVRLLGRDGDIAWPPATDTLQPRPSLEPEVVPELATVLGRRLRTRSTAWRSRRSPRECTFRSLGGVR